MKWGNKIMKNRALKVGTIGAVVLLVLVSMNSVFAVTNDNQKKMNQITPQIINKEMVSDSPYIDPDIHLTRKHLPILKRALAQMGDDPRKDLVQNIISCLEEQGSVTSKDVQRIIKESSAAVVAIHVMKFLAGDGPGNAFCFPFTFLKSQYALFLLLLPAFLPTLLMMWNVEYNQSMGHAPPDMETSVKVGLFNEYDQHTHTSGLVIGYVGLAGSALSGVFPSNLWSSFFFIGYGLFIIIS